MKHSFLCLGLAVLLFSACQDEPIIDNQGGDPAVKAALDEAIMDASFGLGNDFFALPSSNDLAAIPQDPQNELTPYKVALGKLLYHETGLAINPEKAESMHTYSCATCHHAGGGFQAAVPQGISDGGVGFGINGEARLPSESYMFDELDVQPIRTPSILNVAYQENQLWNGQFGATFLNEGTEDQWTEETPKFVNFLGYEGTEIQAIAGLEVHRLGIDQSFIESHPVYKLYFDLAFPGMTDEEKYTLETTGLAIAAYERTVMANQSPWQDYLRGVNSAMSDQEKRGATLFLGKANCVSCHTGPSLNTMSFEALGMGDLDEVPGTYGVNPDDGAHLGRGGFTKKEEDNYKFKVPQLYNLTDSPFFGHGSTFNSVEDVIRYKNDAIAQNPEVPASQLSPEFIPLGLTDDEISDLTVFIEISLHDDNLFRYVPDALPSGYCFPNADGVSSTDLNCD